MFQSGICGCQREKKLRISSSFSSYNYFLNTIFFFFFLDILQLTPCFSLYLPLLISPFLFLLSHKSPPTRYSGIIKIPNLSNGWKNLTFPVNIHLIFIRSDFQSSIYWAYSKWSLVVLTTEDPQNYTNQQSNLFNICKYNGRKQTS